MKKTPISVGIAVVFLALACMAFAAEWHVDAAQPDDSGDGTSWATAKKTMQSAIDLPGVVSNDVIWVANGVYDTGGRANYPAGTIFKLRGFSAH